MGVLESSSLEVFENCVDAAPREAIAMAMGWWLDKVILAVFSNYSDSSIQGQFLRR